MSMSYPYSNLLFFVYIINNLIFLISFLLVKSSNLGIYQLLSTTWEEAEELWASLFPTNKGEPRSTKSFQQVNLICSDTNVHKSDTVVGY
jgi:hypothetical protein